MTSYCEYGCCGSGTTTECCTFSPYNCNRKVLSAESTCSGVNQSTIQQFTNTWEKNKCINVYSNILYDTQVDTTDNGLLIYNPNNLARIQGDIASVFVTYTGQFEYDFTADVNSQKYNSFQDNIIDLCTSNLVPGGCDLALTLYCSKYTQDEIAQDIVKAKLCGCYVSPEYPDVSPACQSLCHMASTAQKADPATGKLVTCDNTVCVIDNNNISLTDTDTTTAFTQICSGCDDDPANPCVCIIGGPNPSQTIVDAGISPTYTQYCGTNSICYNTSTGVAVEVPCPSEGSFGFTAPSYNFPLIFICIIAFVVIIAIVIFAATRGSGSYIETKKEIPYTGPNYDNPQDMLNTASTGGNIKYSGVPRTSSTQFVSK